MKQMREIKFRAWDGAKMFLSPDISEPHHLSSWFDAHSKYGNIPAVCFMQFTGLLDKNGKEIYEGDILAYKSTHPKHNGKIFNNVVEFALDQTIFGWRMRNKSCVVKATVYKFLCSEVIGNIYENPELLNSNALNKPPSCLNGWYC